MIHIDAIAHQSRFSQRYTHARISIILGCIVSSVVIDQLSVYGILAIVSFAYIGVISRQKISVITKILLVPFLFVGVSSLLVAVMFSSSRISDSHLQFKLLNIYVGVTDKSLILAGYTFSRSMSTMIQAFSLSLTIPIIRVVAWMRWIRLPESFVQLFTLSYRMIFVLFEVAQDLITSQTLRFGFKNPKLTFRTLTGMSTSLFMNTFQRLSDMESALKLRSFYEK